ncbi:MAG TPA: imidazole glycerol phosphate synthase subunit HisH [Opitutales bacterium]|nr:imidazole glycerol phosphate synthase subunit HisH [Opitutales bacterium]
MSDTSASPPPALDLAVIDYGMGNLRSVLRAFDRVGGKPRLVTTPAEAKTADALVFPGQGAIMDCMRLLKNTGLDETIHEWIAADRPFFGVCLGLQALFEHSEEGDTKGLGVFPGQVVRFRLTAPYKIPHMGWNNVRWGGAKGGADVNSDLALSGISPANDQFYFVHSYHAETPDRALVWGETEYGYAFTSAIRRGNCFATQFHPEKSQAKGLQLYRNFLDYAARKPAQLAR